MRISSKNLFFIDSAGALTTAIIIGLVLVHWQSLIGMPISTLYFLAILGLGFALYSLTCALCLKRRVRPFLQILIAANVAYCLLSLGLVAYHFQTLTMLGLTYFLLEVLVIAAVITVEIKSLRSLQK